MYIPSDTNCRISASFVSTGRQNTVDQVISMSTNLANQFNNIRAEQPNTIRNDLGCPEGLYFVCMSTGAYTNLAVRVELTGNYNFDTISGRQTYPISVQREDRNHQGIDSLARCTIVRSATEFSLTLRSGDSYRYLSSCNLLITAFDRSIEFFECIV